MKKDKICFDKSVGIIIAVVVALGVFTVGAVQLTQQSTSTNSRAYTAPTPSSLTPISPTPMENVEITAWKKEGVLNVPTKIVNNEITIYDPEVYQVCLQYTGSRIVETASIENKIERGSEHLYIAPSSKLIAPEKKGQFGCTSITVLYPDSIPITNAIVHLTGNLTLTDNSTLTTIPLTVVLKKERVLQSGLCVYQKPEDCPGDLCNSAYGTCTKTGCNNGMYQCKLPGLSQATQNPLYCGNHFLYVQTPAINKYICVLDPRFLSEKNTCLTGTQYNGYDYKALAYKCTGSKMMCPLASDEVQCADSFLHNGGSITTNIACWYSCKEKYDIRADVPTWPCMQKGYRDQGDYIGIKNAVECVKD